MTKPSHNHPYHMVTPSPWPLLTSFSLSNMLMGMAHWLHTTHLNFMVTGLITLSMCVYQWWRDVIRESTFQGLHTSYVMNLIRMGMILFIISEFFFFVSFFWTFFHMALSPSVEIGMTWPPSSLTTFNPYNIPLLNTIVLLMSSISITWSHFSILNKNFPESQKSLLLTITLALYFSTLQFMEYTEANFTISDSSYGSTFFLITGFHGIHVIIGTMFISISLLRLKNFHFSPTHHFGFEASAWYWHFVDMIWMFVYIFIYWWDY